MKTEFKHIRELSELLLEYTSLDWDEVNAYAESEEFFTIYDEDYFKETMGDIPNTPENMLKYYERNPEQLEVVVDYLKGEDELHSWNVNAWRNS